MELPHTPPPLPSTQVWDTDGCWACPRSKLGQIEKPSKPTVATEQQQRPLLALYMHTSVYAGLIVWKISKCRRKGLGLVQQMPPKGRAAVGVSLRLPQPRSVQCGCLGRPYRALTIYLGVLNNQRLLGWPHFFPYFWCICWCLYLCFAWHHGHFITEL